MDTRTCVVGSLVSGEQRAGTRVHPGSPVEEPAEWVSSCWIIIQKQMRVLWENGTCSQFISYSNSRLVLASKTILFISYVFLRWNCWLLSRAFYFDGSEASNRINFRSFLRRRAFRGNPWLSAIPWSILLWTYDSEKWVFLLEVWRCSPFLFPLARFSWEHFAGMAWDVGMELYFINLGAVMPVHLFRHSVCLVKASFTNDTPEFFDFRRMVKFWLKRP